MYAAADGGVQSAAQQRVGGGPDERLLLLHVKALLVCRVAQCQQRHHVGLRQRGIGAVVERQFFRRSMQAEGNVVVLDARRGVQIDIGLNADRVGEVDVTTLQIVAGPGDDAAALGDGDAAQQRRRGHGAAQAQIDVAGQLGIGILEAQLR